MVFKILKGVSWLMRNIKKLKAAQVLEEEGGSGLVSLEEKHFVVVKVPTLKKLHAMYRAFKAESCEFLANVYVKTPDELQTWVGGEKYDFDSALCPPKCPIGLKIDGHTSMRLGWLDHKPVVKAAIDLGEIEAAMVSSDGMRMKKGTGRFHEIMWRKSLKKQQAVIRHAFDPMRDDHQELTRKIQQGSCFDFIALEKVLWKAKTPEAFLERLATILLQDFNSKKRGTNIANFWFSLYLAREGIWFFPRVDRKRLGNLTPRILWRFFWDFAVPKAAVSTTAKMFINKDRIEEADRLRAAHLEFLLRTNLFQDFEGINEFILYTAKGNDAACLYKKFNKDHRNMSFNLYFDRMLSATGKVRSDYEELAAYFGGGGRIASSKLPFSWMLQGEFNRAKKNSLRMKVLKKWNYNCPKHVSTWIEELELAVRLSPRKSKKSFVQSLNYWVYYLLSLDEADCPGSFREIDRVKHIYSTDEDDNTFLKFMSGIPVTQQERGVQVVRQAWLLVSHNKGFPKSITNPVHEMDVPRAHSYAREHGLGFRTKRKSLGKEKLELLIKENRKADEDGQPFAFARKYCGKSQTRIYYRDVENKETGNREKVFFPVPPIYLDILLNTGMRSHSGRWLDSGEGDEYWVDCEALDEVSNPLATAEKGRQQGFLRLHDVESGGCVVGMYLPVSKTGPQAVPWVDEETAKYFEMMREWQIKYNPQGKPIKAADDLIDKIFAREGDLPEVYPIFRDPRRKDAQPPSYSTLAEYFYALLKHCEKIYNDQRRERLGDAYRWEPFFINDTAKWTLHSLRVTLVSTLIEAGVPPSVVQVLMGHKSLVMTFHYVAVDNAATHEQINKGIEARRQSLIEELEHCESSEEASRILENGLGGAFSALEAGHCGADLFRHSFERDSDRDFTVFSHGICPGGDCKTGGEVSGTKAYPVFRPRACSRCRYRITGPAFLNGLVLRLNQLMYEIYESFERQGEYEDARLDAEDAGKSTYVHEQNLEAHREDQEELFGEWAAELVTIQKCQAAIQNLEEGQRLPVITGLVGSEIDTRLTEGHKLTLLQSILSDAETIDGVELEVPEHIRLQRDEILLNIAEANDAGQFFYRLPKDQRERALNEFGKMFIEHQEMVDERGAALIDEMIAGSEVSKDKVLNAVRAIIAEDENQGESKLISMAIVGE